MQPAQPIIVVDRFPEERAALLDLLASLAPDDWSRLTVCDPWDVSDLAAHIVADDLGVVSRGRDAHRGLDWFDASSQDALLASVDRQNREWVIAMRRMSPRVLVGLLRFSGQQSHAYFASLDPYAAGEPVSWAGPEPAPVWLGLARECSERWVHQQQIRDAVGAPALTTPSLFAPVLDAFVRALPHTFRDSVAAVGTHVTLDIEGIAGGMWTVRRDAASWSLHTGAPDAPSARVTLPQDAAWRLFTKGITPAQARAHARLEGDPALAAQVLETVSVIA
jgi:uncharacterized protein (TIGR03083 family)